MNRFPRQNHRVLQVVTRLLVPFVILFGLYVQFHGDYGPGGGFQAGVIVAAAFILYGLIFGVQRVRLVLPPSVARWMMSAGVLLYAGTGAVTMLLGGNLLDYDALAHDPLHGQHWGIFAVELGVGVTVTGVMIGLFYLFASARDLEDRRLSGQLDGPAVALGDAHGRSAGDWRDTRAGSNHDGPGTTSKSAAPSVEGGASEEGSRS